LPVVVSKSLNDSRNTIYDKGFWVAMGNLGSLAKKDEKINPELDVPGTSVVNK
jgi:hypothetical protein